MPAQNATTANKCRQQQRNVHHSAGEEQVRILKHPKRSQRRHHFPNPRSDRSSEAQSPRWTSPPKPECPEIAVQFHGMLPVLLIRSVVIGDHTQPHRGSSSAASKVEVLQAHLLPTGPWRYGHHKTAKVTERSDGCTKTDYPKGVHAHAQ